MKTQVIVLTCRPQDYLSDTEMPQATAWLDLAGGAIRAVDLARVMTVSGLGGAGGAGE